MKLVDVEQGSPEWLDARVGVLTASKMANCFTKTGNPSKAGLNNVCNELAAERFGYIEKTPSFKSDAMQRGHDLEPVARAELSRKLGETIEEKGIYISNCGLFGFSPDGIIQSYKGDATAGVEIKCPMMKNHMNHFMTKEIPFKYRVQMAYSMHLSNIKTWVYCSYHPDAGMFMAEYIMSQEMQAKIIEMMDAVKDMTHLKEVKLFGEGYE